MAMTAPQARSDAASKARHTPVRQERPMANPGIDRIKPHMVLPDASTRKTDPILLNSNESAYGPSPAARAAAQSAVDAIERYIEAPGRFLIPALAARYRLDPERIAIGFGSDDLIARLARAYLAPGDELIRTANGYLKVPNYAYASGASVISVPDAEFVPSVDAMLAALTPRTRVVYVANPENPAGTYISASEIDRLHAQLPAHVLLVLDCAYEEYVTAADYAPATTLVEEAQNVVVTRTFSKAHGLAGARVGWAYGPPEIVDILSRIGVTFPMTSPSLAAALAALEDRGHVDEVCRRNADERARLSQGLAAMGLKVTPSQTNFVLVHFPGPAHSAAGAERFLAKRGILIRRFAAPAFSGALRITLGLPEQNAACLAALDAFLKPPPDAAKGRPG